jgi:CheY-like chemotaxis protein
MKHIVVVDDDAASREAATGILNGLGCAVEAMADGGTALERLQYELPDAVLVDLNIADKRVAHSCAPAIRTRAAAAYPSW